MFLLQQEEIKENNELINAFDDIIKNDIIK